MIFLSVTIALCLLQKNSCTSQYASAELDGNMAIYGYYDLYPESGKKKIPLN